MYYSISSGYYLISNVRVFQSVVGVTRSVVCIIRSVVCINRSVVRIIRSVARIINRVVCIIQSFARAIRSVVYIRRLVLCMMRSVVRIIQSVVARVPSPAVRAFFPRLFRVLFSAPLAYSSRLSPLSERLKQANAPPKHVKINGISSYYHRPFLIKIDSETFRNQNCHEFSVSSS